VPFMSLPSGINSRGNAPCIRFKAPYVPELLTRAGVWPAPQRLPPHVLPVRTLAGRSALMSEPGRAAASLVLTRSSGPRLYGSGRSLRPGCCRAG
jgi:hypothetical protein